MIDLYDIPSVRSLMETTDDVFVLRNLVALEAALHDGDEIAQLNAIENLYDFTLKNGIDL